LSLFVCYLSPKSTKSDDDDLVFDLEEDVTAHISLKWKGPLPFTEEEAKVDPYNCSQPVSPASSTGFDTQHIDDEEEDSAPQMESAPSPQGDEIEPVPQKVIEEPLKQTPLTVIEIITLDDSDR
jgi:hypothetical protein